MSDVRYIKEECPQCSQWEKWNEKLGTKKRKFKVWTRWGVGVIHQCTHCNNSWVEKKESDVEMTDFSTDGGVGGSLGVITGSILDWSIFGIKKGVKAIKKRQQKQKIKEVIMNKKLEIEEEYKDYKLKIHYEILKEYDKHVCTVYVISKSTNNTLFTVKTIITNEAKNVNYKKSQFSKPEDYDKFFINKIIVDTSNNAKNRIDIKIFEDYEFEITVKNVNEWFMSNEEQNQ